MRRTLAWLALGLAAAGPVSGYGIYRAARAGEQRRTLSRFGETVQERTLVLKDEIDDAMSAVTAMAVLLDTFPVASGQYQRFASELLRRRPSLAALSWIAVVPSGMREGYQREVAAAGKPGYCITERLASGDLGPARPRDVYYPVSFIEPLPGNERAVGFDLGSEPVRQAAVARALRTGKPTISDPILLVQESGAARSVLILASVHGPGAPVEGGKSRGLASGVLRIEDVVVRALLHTSPHEMSVELADQGPGGTGAVFYASPVHETATASAGSPSWRGEIPVGTRRLTLTARPTAAYLARQRTNQPAVIGLGAFLGWELLLGMGLLAGKWSRERARRRATGFATSVIRSVAEGVMVADTKGNLLLVNDAARSVVGSGRTETPLSDWSREFGLYRPGTNDPFPSSQLPLVRAMRGEEVTSTEILVRNDLVPEGAWVSVTASPIRDAGGVVTGGVAVFRDVTESRRAAELTERLSRAVAQTADAVLITNRAGLIEYVNPAFETMTGYTSAEAVGRTPRLLKSGKQEVAYYRSLWTTLLGGETFNSSVVNRKKSGELFWAEQTITPMIERDSGEITHFVSVMRDMTDRMKLQQQEIEMRLGAAVQKRLFPQQAPVLSGYDIAGAASPAVATCGDYYDFIWRPDGELGIVVADVSGHGVPAALIMTMTRSYLHSLAHSELPLDRVVAELNALVLEDLDESHFVTMVLVLLDPRTGALEWVNSGHPSAFVLGSRGEERERLESTCRPLGLFPMLGCTPGRRLSIEAGEMLVLVTDGVLEAAAPDAGEFGSERVLRIACLSRDLPAEQIASRIIAEAQAFTGGQPQEDDLTVVVCKRLARA